MLIVKSLKGIFMKNEVWINYLDGREEKIRFTDVEIKMSNIDMFKFLLEDRGYIKLGYILNEKTLESYDVYCIKGNSVAVVKDKEDFDFFRKYPTYLSLMMLFEEKVKEIL